MNTPTFASGFMGLGCTVTVPLRTVKVFGMSDEANVDVAAADDAVPLVPEGDSLVYEEELLRNPYSLKLWLRYLEVPPCFLGHIINTNIPASLEFR
jgi:hypothetical protein